MNRRKCFRTSWLSARSVYRWDLHSGSRSVMITSTQNNTPSSYASHFVVLDSLPDSVHFRRWFCERNGRTALEIFIEEQCRVAAWPPTKLAFNERDKQQAAALSARYPVTVTSWARPLSLEALRSIGRRDSLCHVVISRIECLLAPADIGRTLLARHQLTDNAVSWVTGIPVTTTPLVFNMSFVEDLCATGVAELQGDCWLALEFVKKIGTHNLGI